MSRVSRRRWQVRPMEALESRQLLAAPEVLGNAGQILFSQFQPYGFKTTVGMQIQDVALRGRIRVDVDSPNTSTGSESAASLDPINTGLIDGSQFNGGGFRTIGVQLRKVFLGGGMTISGTDDEVPVPHSSALTTESVNPAYWFRPTVLNKNLIRDSQFNDGGFGVLDREPDGTIIAREGRVGLQWLRTRIRGPVDVGIDDQIIRPGSSGAPSALKSSNSLQATEAGQTIVEPTTNTGEILRSQFNDGGFGDIGMQWSDVAVGGRVGTSTNTLFINPLVDGGSPITVRDQVFGTRATASSTQANAPGSLASPARLTAQAVPFRTTDTNSATNSGRIIDAQFNDGGFGDIGLQWKKVKVGGDVTAVHNSLTVQPENKGQGLITVQGVRFPNVPRKSPRPAPQSPRVLEPSPAVIASDGDPVQNLPTPTGPLSPFFSTPFQGPGTVTLPFPGNYPLVNSASNSGLIKGGQFSAGGFGDNGLQWQKVNVSGHVRVVHNSLSVHPEGSGLEGISVSDVSYGPAVSRRTARHLAVLPYAVISTGDLIDSASTSSNNQTVLHPPNDRLLVDQQLAATSGTDVFLQWNGIDHRRGLVIVHNTIKITGVGPETGPITLQNIRFPFRVPTFAPLGASALQPTVTVGDDPRDAVLLNTANNSGILNHAQFSDGGFGDDGMQWRNVSIEGSVDVVHNTLAVDTSSDLPPGDVPGPITISGVTFNSQALDTDLSPRKTRVLLSPPDVFQRVSSRPINLGRPLKPLASVRDESTNSGIMAGGQIAAGGANHTMLQWQCVLIRGGVKIIDNVLSISVQDRPSSPIIISDVTFT